MLLIDPTAIKLNDIIRKHWSIENKLHWFLDENLVKTNLE